VESFQPNIIISQYLNWLAQLSPAWSIFIYLVAVFGGWLIIFILLLSLDKKESRRHTWLTIIIAFLSAILAFFLAEMLKNIIPLPRPYLVLSEIVPVFIPIGVGSFPSGHAAVFGAISLAVYWRERHLGLWLLLITLLLCLARIAAGIHYALDIIVGLVIGYLAALLISKIVSYLRNKQG